MQLRRTSLRGKRFQQLGPVLSYDNAMKEGDAMHGSVGPDERTQLDSPCEVQSSQRRPSRIELGEARLVEGARDGDDDAFAALVVLYEGKLIRVLARLVHDEELARDLAQETFWRVYTRLDQFDTG